MTNSQFNTCTEEIASVMDKYFKREIDDLTQINECVEHYRNIYDKELSLEGDIEQQFFDWDKGIKKIG